MNNYHILIVFYIGLFYQIKKFQMNLILKLKLLLEQTKLQLIGKEQVNMYLPQLNGYVDFILITKYNYICFKDFWTFNNLTLDIIQKYQFISSQINSINPINPDKKYIFIILNKNTKKNFLSNNIQNNIIILQKNNLDKLLTDLSYLLYREQIYFYDADMDTIMLE